MKLFDGTGFLVAKTHAKVITAFLRGAERLPFSRNPGRKQWFPRISVHFSNVHQTPDLAGASMSAARVEVTDWLRDRMVRQQFETEMEFGHDTVPEAIQEAARRLSGKVVLEDVSLQQVSYRRLFTGAQLLAAEWRRRLSGGATECRRVIAECERVASDDSQPLGSRKELQRFSITPRVPPF
jgi:acyl-[acyl-carrier-protein]-phospholipid O-acyltransferase/long-chain-fatty-acid--[acyl-carrier-protein] ligase